jgi:hypothetical protein
MQPYGEGQIALYSSRLPRKKATEKGLEYCGRVALFFVVAIVWLCS